MKYLYVCLFIVCTSCVSSNQEASIMPVPIGSANFRRHGLGRHCIIVFHTSRLHKIRCSMVSVTKMMKRKQFKLCIFHIDCKTHFLSLYLIICHLAFAGSEYGMIFWYPFYFEVLSPLYQTSVMYLAFQKPSNVS